MPLERFRRQELSPVAWEAGSVQRTAAVSLDSIVNHRPGRLLSPVHRTGWARLGWAGWAYKVPDAACQKIPCPSAATRELWGHSQ